MTAPGTLVMLDQNEMTLIRLGSVVREPATGKHRKLVVFTAPVVGIRETSRRLRYLADRLDDLAQEQS